MQRVRDFISYLEGKVQDEPKMADKLEDMAINPQMRQDIADLLKKSQALSENIYQTEQEIQNIANLLKQLQVNHADLLYLILKKIINCRT